MTEETIKTINDSGGGGSTASPGPARYAVVGQPVKHSLSPLIHRHFAQRTGDSLSYDLLEAQPGDFAATVTQFFAAGGNGLNVTLPFKEQARDIVQRLSPEAAAAGAVNTIVRTDGVLEGHNTDGVGLVRDLESSLGWGLETARILLIGAGGASRGALAALLKRDPARLVLTNRTLERAENLIAEVAPNDARAQVLAAAELNEAFDVVINATSASLAGQGALVPTQIVRGARCYDMLYSPTQTVFCGWAQSHGAAEVADGLGMLLEQAAESFTLWRGVRPDTGDLLDNRRALFAAKQSNAATLNEFQKGATSRLQESQENSEKPGVKKDEVESDAEAPLKRFIAGAVCPQCREVDRIVVRMNGSTREQACIACGYLQPEVPSEAQPDASSTQTISGSVQHPLQLMVPRGKHERASSTDSALIPSQPVRFIDPQTRSGPAETPLPKKPWEDRD